MGIGTQKYPQEEEEKTGESHVLGTDISSSNTHGSDW